MSKGPRVTVDETVGNQTKRIVEEESIELSMIKMGLHQLVQIRKRQGSTVSLDRDIRLYEFILKGTRQEQIEKANQYSNARHPAKGDPDFPIPRDRGEVIRKLGWKV